MTPNSPVGTIPLIGPRFTRLLSRLNIATVRDLLLHVPARYDDFRKTERILTAVEGDVVTIRGNIQAVRTTKTPRRRIFLTEVILADDTGEIRVIWFNQPFLGNVFKTGSVLQVSGIITRERGRHEMHSPAFELVRHTPPIHTGRLVPIYPETHGISSKWLRSRIAHVLATMDLPDWRDKDLSLHLALRAIHFPKNDRARAAARRRLGEDELLILHAKALDRRQRWNSRGEAPALTPANQKTLLKTFIAALPFVLTNDQNRALADILRDISRRKPMNRLLQGDVGAGKTVVASIAMFLAANAGYTSLLMAPTEILAQQHFKTVTDWLTPFGIPVLLQTSSRKDLPAEMVKPAVVIGTHALLVQTTDIPKVGLIVIDEQHRFGVEQRRLLRQKGESPHVLTMTATPIPRTVALTVYGDLAVSSIDELPPGRLSVKTYLVPPAKREGAVAFMKKHIRQGMQAFIICPFIEPSESLLGIRAATVEYERLSRDVFPEKRLVLLHGRITSRKKERILHEFQNNAFDILVSTPVVEVGIDVPNATFMLIEGAERFGLAELHQLRGRVGRGSHQSFCLLFSDQLSPPVIRRLKAFERIRTGRELAELDLKLRGPGELYGTLQHGPVELRLADLTDLQLVEETRKEARDLWESHRAIFSNPWIKHHFETQSEPN